MDADERDGLLMGSRGFRGSAALLHKQIMTERLQRQTSSNQEEAYQTEEGQSQRTLMEMQLRQLLFEYGQAQETIEENRPQRSRKRRGPSAVKAALQQEKQVGRLALMAGAASWQGNKDVQEDRYLLDLELESREGTKIAGFLVLDGHSGSLCCDHLMERLPGNLQIHGFGRKEEILYMTG
eukprot:s2496_g15.t1